MTYLLRGLLKQTSNNTGTVFGKLVVQLFGVIKSLINQVLSSIDRAVVSKLEKPGL
jgi:hypothetical protein